MSGARSWEFLGDKTPDPRSSLRSYATSNRSSWTFAAANSCREVEIAKPPDLIKSADSIPDGCSPCDFRLLPLLINDPKKHCCQGLLQLTFALAQLWLSMASGSPQGTGRTSVAYDEESVQLQAPRRGIVLAFGGHHVNTSNERQDTPRKLPKRPTHA